MLLDTEKGLSTLQVSFTEFLAAPSISMSFAAATNGSPEPYGEFLSGLRVCKGDANSLHLTADRWLELSGSPQELLAFQQRLSVAHGNHSHWRSNPVSLIIEADDSWPTHEG